MDGTQQTDRIVAITIAILLTVSCIVELYPFVSVLPWAVILCFVTWLTFLWGMRLLGGRRSLAATLMALLPHQASSRGDPGGGHWRKMYKIDISY